MSNKMNYVSRKDAQSKGRSRGRPSLASSKELIQCDTCDVYNCTTNHGNSPKAKSPVIINRSSDVTPQINETSDPDLTTSENEDNNSSDAIPPKDNSPKSSGRILKQLNKSKLSSPKKTSSKSRVSTGQSKVIKQTFSPEANVVTEEEKSNQDAVVLDTANAENSLSSNADQSVPNDEVVPEATDSELQVGDLMWSKIPGHPYWPCIVSYDSVQGIYKKSKTARDMKQTIYHVRYFGPEAEHGWTLPYASFPYEGLSKYEDLSKEVQVKADKMKSSLKKKLLAKYNITPARRPAWTVSTNEAELALSMTRSDRKEFFNIDSMPSNNTAVEIVAKNEKVPGLLHNKSKKSSVKRKRILSTDKKNKRAKQAMTVISTNNHLPSAPEIEASTSNEKDASTSNEKEAPSSAGKGILTVPEKKCDGVKPVKYKRIKVKPKPKGNIILFLNKHVNHRWPKYPELSKDELIDILTKEWNKMTDIQKRRYVPFAPVVKTY